jgi:hypothetical protein
MPRRKDERSARVLPVLRALLRFFDPMIDGVPHHVHQRIGDDLEDRLVDLGIPACHHHIDLLIL